MQYKKWEMATLVLLCHWHLLLTTSFNAIYDMTQVIPTGWVVTDLSFLADIPL
jgi:hypothetical protein